MGENISEALIDTIALSNSDTAGILVLFMMIMVGIAAVSIHYRRKYETLRESIARGEEPKDYDDK